MLDKDGSGFIDGEEVRTLANRELQRDCSNEEYTEFVRGIDLNADGRIDLKEYLNGLLGVGWQIHDSATQPNWFIERLTEMCGADVAKQMQDLSGMMCRNARLRQDILEGVNMHLRDEIATLFGVSEVRLQQVLLSGLVDCSLKRWREGLPKLVEGMMANVSGDQPGEFYCCHAVVRNELQSHLRVAAELAGDSLEKLKHAVQAVIPPFDLEHMADHHVSVCGFVLHHSDEVQPEDATAFLRSLHGIIHGEGAYLKSVNDILELLRKLSPKTSRESIRATYEIVSFAEHP